MKILILANSSGGLYLFRYDLIKALQKKAIVVAAAPLKGRLDELRELTIKLIDTSLERRGTSFLADFKLYWQYRKTIKAEKPDLVITYTIKPNIYGGLASRMTRTPYVANITGLGTAFENRGKLFILAKTLNKIALKKAKVVFFENQDSCDFFVNERIVKETQTHVLHGAGVDTERFYYQPYPENDSFHFLFIGRIMKEKGINELIAAMKRLRSKGYNVVLDVLGIYEEKEYKEILEENKDWLIYHGQQKDVRPFIGQTDCFVLPSYHEGMANTNLENASSGRPIITSNIPGCREAIIDGVSGLLCEPKNADNLYEKMKLMMERSRAEREDMGVVGRKHIASTFDKKKVVEETINSIFA